MQPEAASVSDRGHLLRSVRLAVPLFTPQSGGSCTAVMQDSAVLGGLSGLHPCAGRPTEGWSALLVVFNLVKKEAFDSE